MNAAELLPFKANQSFSFFDKSTGPLHKCISFILFSKGGIDTIESLF